MEKVKDVSKNNRINRFDRLRKNFNNRINILKKIIMEKYKNLNNRINRFDKLRKNFKLDNVYKNLNNRINSLDKLSKKFGKDGTKYRGTNNITVDGIRCQNWTQNYKDNNKFIDFAKKNKLGLGNHNYCRNPEPKKKKDIWCYTDNQFNKNTWGYCDRKYSGYKFGELLFNIITFIIIIVFLIFLFLIFNQNEKTTYKNISLIGEEKKLIFDPDSSIGFDGIEY